MQKAQNVSSIPPNTLKNNIYSIPEELKNISDLTDHNILDSTLHHHQQDANKYQKTSIHKDNPSFVVIIQKKKMELAQYLHAACFSQVQSTFEKAIKKIHFKAGPGLNANILKHLPTSIATV